MKVIQQSLNTVVVISDQCVHVLPNDCDMMSG